MNCMCFSQCCNKVIGKPSPATAGSRATLHRFFETPENTTKQVKSSDSDQREEETGEAVTIALPVDRIEEDRPGGPEYLEVGATAYIPSKHSDFAIFTGLKDIRREEKESAPEEGGKGDAIAIALPLDNGDEAKEVAREDNKVGAKAATSEKQSDFAIFAQKEERTRRALPGDSRVEGHPPPLFSKPLRIPQSKSKVQTVINEKKRQGKRLQSRSLLTG